MESALGRAVPPDAGLIAVIDLARLRATPLYAHLPPAALALSQPDSGASAMLFAVNGNDVLILLQGHFTPSTVPAGGVLLGRDLAATGSSALVARAAAQFKKGNRASPPLLDYAATRTGDAALWIAARGGSALPLSGNYANLNRLLNDVEYAVLAVRTGPRCEIRLDARGRDEVTARHFEETVRAMLSLAAAAEARRADLAALLGSATVRRDGADVAATLTASPDQAAALLDRLAH